MTTLIISILLRGENYSANDFVDETNVYYLKYLLIFSFVFFGYLIYKVALPSYKRRNTRKRE